MLYFIDVFVGLVAWEGEAISRLIARPGPALPSPWPAGARKALDETEATGLGPKLVDPRGPPLSLHLCRTAQLATSADPI